MCHKNPHKHFYELSVPPVLCFGEIILIYAEENNTCGQSSSTVEAARLFFQCVSSQRHHDYDSAKYITALLSAVAS